MVLVPAFLMVSTIRFRSVKAIDVGWRRSYLALFLGAVALALIATHPRLALVRDVVSYVICASRASIRPSRSTDDDSRSAGPTAQSVPA